MDSVSAVHSVNLANSISYGFCSTTTHLITLLNVVSVSPFVRHHHQITLRTKCIQFRKTIRWWCGVRLCLMVIMAWEIGSSGFHGIMLRRFKKRFILFSDFPRFFVVVVVLFVDDGLTLNTSSHTPPTRCSL